MKTKDLLSQLSRMEHSLHDFSFEELTSSEATQLKKSFETFKKSLETKIFQPAVASGFTTETEFIPEKPSPALDSNMLVAQVSHEIRTPLNGIIGFTDLLKEDDSLNKNQLEQVNAIQKASYSLMEIINELLEYSKLSAGLESFESVDFNFRNVVGDVAYLCSNLVSGKDIELVVKIEDEIPETLLGDPSKLTQVLLNLLGNAIKFVAKGKISLYIALKEQLQEHVFLAFKITDTGIGISKENLPHIFDSFKQAETNTFSKYGGSGLGLSIVKQIIEKSGGEISVSSELGVGTTFEFSIPYKLGNAKNLSQPPQDGRAVFESQKELVKNMRILVFEDNPLNQRLIDQRLKAWGCKTYITDNAQYGLNILANHPIDLVLMDLKMPVKNGFEITGLIRGMEDQRVKRLPIVALSADFSARDKEQSERYGIDDFILKPYSSDELLSKLIKNKKNMKMTLSMESHSINPITKVTEQHELNLANVLEECMGQLDLLQELVVLYKQNALEFIGSVRMHLKSKDIEQIGFAAHKIKSGLVMMKSNSLHSIVVQIQNCCKTDADEKHLHFLFECFVTEYPKVAQALDLAMEKLSE